MPDLSAAQAEAAPAVHRPGTVERYFGLRVDDVRPGS